MVIKVQKMNEQLVQRVKIALAKQFYCMNDSWLQDCIEYFFQDNQNPSQEEIITFVKNQWQLSDLREINNENGSLPKNLTNTKCTSLPGRYILQMEKVYDISLSKYKQLEKIRQVSSENVDATENENTNQEDKFQAWEPKSKRMLQLYLTDGIQDVTAIEYKPIRFLKDSLFPGYKLLIKGPVLCRKGVILLEEMNIAEIGGEVDSLLIVNAVENIFARALNLKENPDPYGDVKKNIKNEINSQAVDLMEDDFELDSQSIAQIDKQIQNSNSSKNTSTVTKNNITSSGCNSSNLGQSNNNRIQKGFADDDDDDSFLAMVDEKAFQNIPTSKTSVQQKLNVSNQPSSFSRDQNQDDFPTEDELNEFDESPFFDNSKSVNQISKKNNLTYSSATSSKVSTSNQSAYTVGQLKHKNTVSDTFKKSPTKHQSYNNSLTRSPSSSNSKSTTRKSPKKNINSLFKFPSSPPKIKNSLKSSELKQKSFSTSPKKSDSCSNLSNKSSPSKSKAYAKPSSSQVDDFPDVDFHINDYDLSSDFSDNIRKNYQNNVSNSKSDSRTLPKPSIKSNDTFSSKKISTHEISKAPTKSTVSEIFDTQIGDEFNEEFESKSESYRKTKVSQNVSPKMSDKTSATYENKMSIDFSSEQTGVKRLASIRSPSTDTPLKKSCTHSTPIKDNSSETTEMREFITEEMEVNEDTTMILDLLFNVLKYSLTKEGSQTVVRGIVTKIVKLNLLKKDHLPYFYLEGTITDYTEKLDVVFSSEVLEKIIGMSPLEFSQKRRLAKASPDIKEELRSDLQKAENRLRNLDVVMELELKKNEKALITSYVELTDLHKKLFDEKVKKYAKEKYKK